MSMRQKLFPIFALLLMAATGAVAPTYNVTVKSGTVDAANWTASLSLFETNWNFVHPHGTKFFVRKLFRCIGLKNHWQ